jgi:hypothetical protein
MTKINSNIEIATPGANRSSVHLGSIHITGSGNHVSVQLSLRGSATAVKGLALESLRRLSVDPSCVDKPN